MAPVRELMREKGKTGKEGLEEARKDVSLHPLIVHRADDIGVQSSAVENERFCIARLSCLCACRSESEDGKGRRGTSRLDLIFFGTG